MVGGWVVSDTNVVARLLEGLDSKWVLGKTLLSRPSGAWPNQTKALLGNRRRRRV